MTQLSQLRLRLESVRARVARMVPLRARMPVFFALTAVVAALLGWAIHAGRITNISGFDRAAAQAEIDRAGEFLRTVRGERERRPELDRRINAVVDRSLGERTDAVDNALRARLNRIAEETGIRDLMVATGVAVIRKSPARQELSRIGLSRSQRDEPDFIEQRATLSGEGAIDQVLRLIYRINVDPMLKRVEALRLQPIKDGARVKVTLRLSTIFVPGREPATLPPAPTAEVLAGFSKYATLASRNPFRVPVAPAPSVAVQVASQSPAAADGTTPSGASPVATAEVPGGFPYGQWLLTGVVDGPAGTEAYFRNAATGEGRVLRVNETIAEFSFVGLEADAARIAAGGATYRVRVGDSLEGRALAGTDSDK